MPVFPEIMENLKKLFPYAEIKIIYGLSEAEPISELCYNELDENDINKMKNGEGLLAGKIIDNRNLLIIENNQEISPKDPVKILKTGEAGEIIVSGEHMPAVYINDARDGGNKARLSIDGKCWHRTGDLGYIDES